MELKKYIIRKRLKILSDILFLRGGGGALSSIFLQILVELSFKCPGAHTHV